MKKDEFISEIDLDKVEKYQKGGVDKYIDYAYEMYIKKVHPFRSVITDWRVKNDDRPNLEELRLILDLPRTLFEIYKDMDSLKPYLDINKSIMKYKAQMDLQEAIELAKENGQINAKLLEMQLKRYDIDYTKISEGKHDEGTPNKIRISFEDGSMSDVEISQKSGRKIEE